MKVVNFDHLTKCLDAFDTALEEFNEMSTKVIPTGMAISFLKSTLHGNSDLLSACETCETIRKNISAGSVPTYDQYFEYIFDHAKKLEVAVTDNTTSQKANISESDYLQPYLHSNSCYNNATNLSTYMIDRGGDVDMIQEVFQCTQAMK